MARPPSLFREIHQSLKENIIPSIIFSLNKMGMQYSHSYIEPAHSMCFFNHLGILFPFDVNNLQVVKNEKGNDIRVVVLNIKFNGEISISENINVGQNGLANLGNTSLLFDNYVKMFDNLSMENAFLFLLSKELTEKAGQFQRDIEMLETLLENMKKIHPKITREVLMEKKTRNKK